jgi:hypothetical protein
MLFRNGADGRDPFRPSGPDLLGELVKLRPDLRQLLRLGRGGGYRDEPRDRPPVPGNLDRLPLLPHPPQHLPGILLQLPGPAALHGRLFDEDTIVPLTARIGMEGDGEKSPRLCKPTS